MKMNEDNEFRHSVKPLIMIVEDRKDGREDMSELLNELGCSVITAESSEDALKKYFESQPLDLVFTDIDLSGSSTTIDKSGVDIARFLKTIDNELPVIGYSSKFADNELTEEEISHFNGWYSKGGMSIQTLNKMYGDLKSQAIAHRQKRSHKIRMSPENYYEKSPSLSDKALSDIITTLVQIDKELKQGFEAFQHSTIRGEKYSLEHYDRVTRQADQINEAYLRLSRVEQIAESIKESLDKKSYDERIHELNIKLSQLEMYQKNIDTKMELQASKVFWSYFATFIAILVGIAGLITFILKLTDKP